MIKTGHLKDMHMACEQRLHLSGKQQSGSDLLKHRLQGGIAGVKRHPIGAGFGGQSQDRMMIDVIALGRLGGEAVGLAHLGRIDRVNGIVLFQAAGADKGGIENNQAGFRVQRDGIGGAEFTDFVILGPVAILPFDKGARIKKTHQP